MYWKFNILPRIVGRKFGAMNGLVSNFNEHPSTTAVILHLRVWLRTKAHIGPLWENMTLYT